MVHTFALELLQLLSHPEDGRGLSSFGHRYCQVQPPPAPGVSKEIIWCVLTALGSLFFILAACSKTVHFAHTRPLIALPLSPMSSSPTQTPSAVPTLSMAKLIMHRHVCIAVFRFPFVNLADITSRCSSTYFDDNSPYVITSTVNSHRHAFIAGVGVPTSGPIVSLLSSRTTRSPLYCLSTANNRTKRIAEHAKRVHNASNSRRNDDPNPNHAHQHHCERRYDCDPVRCPSTVVIALFAFAP